MNKLLRNLLDSAGLLARLDPDWNEISLHNNFGAVPRPPGIAGAFAVKGLKLIICSRGQPTLVVHLGDADDADLERESRIVTVLGGSDALAHIVPRHWTAHSSHARLLARRFISGPTFVTVESSLAVDRWLALSRELLDKCEAVCRYASKSLPWLLNNGSTICVAEEVQPLFQTLTSHGFSSEEVAVLERALAVAPDLPRVIQHGDFWPGNLIRDGNAWMIIDFAEFGTSQVALYDLFHFVMHCQRTAFCVGQSTGARDWDLALKALVERSMLQYGMGWREAGTAFLYYLMRITTYRLRPGVSVEYSSPWKAHLRAAVHLLSRGARLEDLVPQ